MTPVLDQYPASPARSRSWRIAINLLAALAYVIALALMIWGYLELTREPDFAPPQGQGTWIFGSDRRAS